MTTNSREMTYPPGFLASGTLIGLIGKKQSGKDSFARTLVDQRGFVRFAFADPMRRALEHLDPLVPGLGVSSYRLTAILRATGWERAKEVYPEVRRLLQEYGQSVRQIDPDFWVKATMQPATEMLRLSPVVITDVRFENEADAVKAAGGTLIRIIRPDQRSTDSHVSENALNDYDVDITIYNDRDLKHLAAQARSLLV